MTDMQKFWFSLVLFLLIATSAQADEVSDVLVRANKGEAEAQAIMGARYAFGCGVEQSHEQSAKWFLKAAEQGEPWAQSEVGEAYLYGIGLPKDESKAAEWLLKADKTRPLIADGLYDLAQMYQSGQGVPQNNVEAYYWFSRSALIPEDNVADDAVIDRDEMAKLLTKAQKAEVEKRLKKFRHLKPWQPKPGSAEDTSMWANCGISEHPNRLQWNAYVIKVPSPSDARPKK